MGIKSLAKQIEKTNVMLDPKQIIPDKKENINNELYIKRLRMMTSDC